MKKRCRICGKLKPVEIIERVNGVDRCYPCGKRARVEQEQMQTLREGKSKKKL